MGLKMSTSEQTSITVKNKSKLIDVVISKETDLKFSKKFDHPFSHVFIYIW